MGVKTRIVPILLWDEHGCVKGRQFSRDRRIGSMADRLQLLERRDVDELIILDVSATPNKRAPRYDEITRYCGAMFCPVTVGGGIRNVSDAQRIIAGGADKVAIGTAAIDHPELIEKLAHKFGSQAVVVSIDVRDGKVWSHCGRAQVDDLDPAMWAMTCEELGAGEILLTAIDRDGMMCGYDLDLIRSVAGPVDIPVIAAGGCGSYDDMISALGAGAHAVASGAMFQFAETTPKEAARYMADRGVATRV